MRRAIPDVTKRQARLLVISVGLFWACVVALPALDGNALGVPLFFLAFAAMLAFYFTLLGIWDAPRFVLPGRGMFDEAGKQWEAMLALFRASFLRSVFRATGWPAWLVGSLLAALLLAVIVVGVAAG